MLCNSSSCTSPVCEFQFSRNFLILNTYYTHMLFGIFSTKIHFSQSLVIEVKDMSTKLFLFRQFKHSFIWHIIMKFLFSLLGGTGVWESGNIPTWTTAKRCYFNVTLSFTNFLIYWFYLKVGQGDRGYFLSCHVLTRIDVLTWGP